MKSNYLDDLRMDMLKVILLLIILTTIIAAAINVLASRSVTAVVLPLTLTLVLFVLFIYRKKWVSGRFVRLTVIILINFVYLPLDWYHSLGITGPMPYYAFLIIVLTLFFINDQWEISIPIISVFIIIVLYRIELKNPKWILVDVNREEKINILMANFILVTSMILMIIYVVIGHFKRGQARLYEISITDYLTGVFNRRYLIENLESMLNRSTREHQDLHILFMDVDKFKLFNDTYGHVEGDQVLKILGKVLGETVRNYDVCGRYGGDEFLVVLPNTNYDEALEVSQRIKINFQRTLSKMSYKEVTISVGISSGQDKTVRDIIDEADQKMYKSKYDQKQGLSTMEDGEKI